MTEVATIAPVRKTLSVNCSPERAFEVFTAEVGSWWPTKTHSIHKDGVTGVILEQHEGGEMYELAEGRREHWARVTAWAPRRCATTTRAAGTSSSPRSSRTRNRDAVWRAAHCGCAARHTASLSA